MRHAGPQFRDPRVKPAPPAVEAGSGVLALGLSQKLKFKMQYLLLTITSTKTKHLGINLTKHA